ncbi:hypothetical protein LWX53_09620, partial [bacterium]|nr:hypothetical protein [bacterium]
MTIKMHHRRGAPEAGIAGGTGATMAGTLLLPLFSALLCAAALPNEVFLEGFWPLGFLCLAPFFLALRDAP